MAKYYYEQWDFMPDLSAFLIGEKSDQMDTSVQLLNKNGNLSGIFTTVRNMRIGEACIIGTEGHLYFRYWEEGRSVQVWVKKSSTSYDAYNTNKPNFIASLRPTILITTIQAEEGTYPDNGIDGDYWYIKTRKAFPDLHIKVNGELRKVQSAWVKVGGHTTPELPEGHREYIAYSNSPDGVQDFSLTPDGHAYVGLYQGLDPDDYRGEGENLWLDSYGLRYVSNNGAVLPTQDEDYGGHRRMRRNPDFDTFPSPIFSVYPLPMYTTTVGETYTESIEVKPEVDLMLGYSLQKTTLCKAGEWTRISKIKTADKTPDLFMTLNTPYEMSASNNPWIEYRRPKVELGSNPNPVWTPAPADILADINNPSSYTWMSKSMYNGVLKEVKDIYIKKDGQLKKGI